MKSYSIPYRIIKKLFRHYYEAIDFFEGLKRNGLQVSIFDHKIRKNQIWGEWKECKNNIVNKFNIPRVKSENSLKGFIFSSAECNTIEKILFDKLNKNINECENYLNNISPDIIHDIYQYYRYFGDFRVANFLRKKVLQAYIDRQSNSKIVSPLSLQACLELDRPELALKMAKENKVKYRDKFVVDEVLAVAYFMLGHKQEAEKLWQKKFRDCDFEYFKYISGKSIAIIGPGKNHLELGAEIDSFDCVIRTNFRIGSNTPNTLYGKRTDVSYYNHERMARNVSEVVDASSEINWIVLKGQHDELRLNKILPDFCRYMRTSYVGDLFFFNNASPMGIQNIVSDIIRFSPKRIKIFNTGFYNSEETYCENYRGFTLGESLISESLRIHELYSGFRFIQNLVKRQLCQVDSLTDEVMSISVDKYASNINNIYSKYILPVDVP